MFCRKLRKSEQTQKRGFWVVYNQPQVSLEAESNGDPGITVLNK